jgi:hypothetical protein
MANTTQNSLNSWLPESEFSLVFEGLVDFPGGQNTIAITLDEPFTYTGNNLVIMSNPIGPVATAPGRAFFGTEVPDFSNRSRVYMDNWVAFDWTQPGMGGDLHANIVLIITELEEVMGSVSGTVTSNGTIPVENALVEIIGTTQERITDANGAYSFNYLAPGTYQFKASKYGHLDATSEVITVIANENSIVNLIIAPNNMFTISGKIIGNDAPDGLEGVTVNLTGYQNYTATTNTTGDFSISDVYDGHIYNITATIEGYQPYSSTIQVSGENLTCNITLIEVAIPVHRITAEKVENNVVVSWKEPSSGTHKVFRYDSGNNNGQVGWSNGLRTSIIGSVHREVEAELRRISWYSTANAVQPAYDLWILGLNSEGMPDRNHVILTAHNIPNTPLQWCRYEFPESVYAPNGFFMGVSPSNGGFTSIGTDVPNSQFPFLPNTNLFSFSAEEDFVCFSENGFYVNAMIRAEGYSFGKTAQFENRTFTNYKIYRLLDGQQGDEVLWSELSTNLSENTYTDFDWHNLSSGVYRYAVKAQYTGGVLSAAGFSNPIKTENSIHINNPINIVLYPNPFTNEILISNPEHVKSVQIMDVLGQTVKHVIFNGKSITTGELSSGLYFVAVETLAGEKMIQKMVKK